MDKTVDLSNTGTVNHRRNNFHYWTIQWFCSGQWTVDTSSQ